MHADIHAIHDIVNIARSREDAYRIFKQMHGFSLPKDIAVRTLDNLLDRKYPQVMADPFKDAVAAKYQITEGLR